MKGYGWDEGCSGVADDDVLGWLGEDQCLLEPGVAAIDGALDPNVRGGKVRQGNHPAGPIPKSHGGLAVGTQEGADRWYYR